MLTKIFSNDTIVLYFVFDGKKYAYNQVLIEVKNECNTFVLFGLVDKKCESLLASVQLNIASIPDGSYDVFVYNYDGVTIDTSLQNLFLQTKLFINRKPCLTL